MQTPLVSPHLLPVLVLALWTLSVLALLGMARVRAGRAGQLTPDDFRDGESARVPEPVRRINRNYMNLLELPVLFYVVSLWLAAWPAAAPQGALGLQWTYVGLRVVHSLIHVGYNRVMHRFAAFAASNVVLVALWLLTAWQVWG